MAVIMTVIVTIIIGTLALVSRIIPKNYSTSSNQKVLVFSHKSDIDRYGLCDFIKTCIQKSYLCIMSKQ